jgi:hypothetical protein
MDEMITLSTQLHLFFVGLLFLLIGANSYLLKKESSFVRLSKRLELLAPQYFIVLFTIFFTGLIVMAVHQFAFSWAVWEMIVAWVLVLVLGIRRHRAYKQLKRFECTPEQYKTFAFRHYVSEGVIVLVSLFFYYGVH